MLESYLKAMDATKPGDTQLADDVMVPPASLYSLSKLTEKNLKEMTSRNDACFNVPRTTINVDDEDDDDLDPDYAGDYELYEYYDSNASEFKFLANQQLAVDAKDSASANPSSSVEVELPMFSLSSQAVATSTVTNLAESAV